MTDFENLIKTNRFIGIDIIKQESDRANTPTYTVDCKTSCETCKKMSYFTYEFFNDILKLDMKDSYVYCKKCQKMYCKNSSLNLNNVNEKFLQYIF